MEKLNFDEILRPYRKGEKGEEGYPTSGNLFELMVNRFHFPPDIVGSAIWKTCYDIAYNGLDFKGDVNVTPGRQLRLYIKQLCATMKRNRVKSQADAQLETVCLQEINERGGTWEQLICFRPDCPKRTQTMKKSKGSRLMRFLLKPRGWWRV